MTASQSEAVVWRRSPPRRATELLVAAYPGGLPRVTVTAMHPTAGTEHWVMRGDLSATAAQPPSWSNAAASAVDTAPRTRAWYELMVPDPANGWFHADVHVMTAAEFIAANARAAHLVGTGDPDDAQIASWMVAHLEKAVFAQGL